MKRLFDFVVSLIGLIVLSPVMAVIALCIVADSKGGVFFRGERVGRYGKSFRIFKFRSMVPDCEGKGKWNVGDRDERITRVGHFLRKSKLDELPQLLNVLKGEMSLVGYRPELRFYVDMYTEEEMPILDLKPGVTDRASMANFEQFKDFTASEDPDAFYLEQVRPLKLRLQLYYRYNHSFWGDIKCLLWTTFKVLTHSQKLPRDVQKIVDDYSAEKQQQTLS